MAQILDMLDEDDPPGKACNIALIPQSEKDAVLTDCDSDGSDMGYEGQRAHLPARLLNANAEIMQVDDDDGDLITTPFSPIHHTDSAATSHQGSQSEDSAATSRQGSQSEDSAATSHRRGHSEDSRVSSRRRGQSENSAATTQQRGQSEDSRVSSHQRGQLEEPRAKLVAVKNKDRVFKRSKRPTKAGIPEHIVYSPNAEECVKQNSPDPMDLFLLMYPPTLREITIEMSNLYSTQTKGKHLNLGMDELLTFYGILLTSGYNTLPRRHMY